MGETSEDRTTLEQEVREQDHSEQKEKMIHKIHADDLDRDVYVISSGGSWLDGVYDSVKAARYAFRFPDAKLRELQNSINPSGVITFEMLQNLRKHMAG